jgi:Kef-type K+ transport system membrane component KefB
MLLSKVLIDLAIILVVAYIVGAMLARIGQPAVIGQIIAGILLGPTLLGLAPGNPSATLFTPSAVTALTVIGQLGLSVFMFTIGWDLDVARVRQHVRTAGTISITSVLLPFTLGLALAAALYPEYRGAAGARVDFWLFAAFIGVSLSITAFPVLAAILAESGMADTRLGALVLSAAAVDDVLGWTALAVVLAALTSGGVWDYTRVGLETALFGVTMLWVIGPCIRRFLRGDALQSGPATGLPIILAGVMASAYVTQVIGIHAVFGAFLLGLVMPRWRGTEALTHWRQSLTPIIWFFLPVYFVVSGLGVDVRKISLTDAKYLCLILLAAVLGKFGGAFLAARGTGLGARDATTVGVLMNTRGLIEIILLTIGLERGIINTHLFTLLVLMALVTTLFGAPLVRRLHRQGPG